MTTPLEEAKLETTSGDRLRELAASDDDTISIMTEEKKQQITPLEEAKLETTQSDRLRELATSNDDTIRKAVTSNPNTPTDILWQLGAEFPEQLLTNPLFDLLLLENPNLFGDMPRETLISLLDCRILPESFFELALNNAGPCGFF